MLNCENHDFVCCFIGGVVHKGRGYLRVTSLRTPSTPCTRPIFGKHVENHRSHALERHRGCARGYRRQCRRGPGSLVQRSEASSVKATERGFNLVIGCKLAALCLREPLEDGRKVRAINRFWFALARREMKDGARNLILAVRWQLADRFKGLF